MPGFEDWGLEGARLLGIVAGVEFVINKKLCEQMSGDFCWGRCLFYTTKLSGDFCSVEVFYKQSVEKCLGLLLGSKF